MNERRSLNYKTARVVRKEKWVAGQFFQEFNKKVVRGDSEMLRKERTKKLSRLQNYYCLRNTQGTFITVIKWLSIHNLPLQYMMKGLKNCPLICMAECHEWHHVYQNWHILLLSSLKHFTYMEDAQCWDWLSKSTNLMLHKTGWSSVETTSNGWHQKLMKDNLMFRTSF